RVRIPSPALAFARAALLRRARLLTQSRGQFRPSVRIPSPALAFARLHKTKYRGVSSMEEHSATDREAEGSSPSHPTRRSTQTGIAAVLRWQCLRVRIPSPAFASQKRAAAQLRLL